jgi:hypothetical protein
MAKLDRTYDIPEIFRVTKSQFRNEFDYTATTASNPSRQAYVAVTVAAPGTTSVVTLTAQVYVAMEIEFFNPIQLTL